MAQGQILELSRAARERRIEGKIARSVVRKTSISENYEGRISHIRSDISRFSGGTIEERFGFVKVSVADVRVEHQVKIADFTKWLERPGRTPREITQRQRIRAILGMSVSR